MAQATIYAHPVSYLSWSSSSSVTSLNENSNTTVSNSSGAVVYWTEGSNSGSISSGGQLTCTKGAVTKKWDFTNQSGGGPQITLTIATSGGG
jgi:thiamine biosynthesis lipoprotein ApbE